jgi:argininosuccinate lyase
MPQKKNPDVPELIRGKTGKVYGDLMAVLTTLKGLPLTYNRDLQEDKAPLFEALDTTDTVVSLLVKVIGGMTVHRQAMAQAVRSGCLLATELADYLVLNGTPFRVAHAIVGRVVRYCVTSGTDLMEISLEELRRFSKAFEKDALDMLSIEGAVERKRQLGGTARQRVAARLKALERELKEEA